MRVTRILIGLFIGSLWYKSQGGNLFFTLGLGVNTAGFASSIGEYSNVVGDFWRGANGKWNLLTWGGNQWTGARATALSKAGYFRAAGKVFLSSQREFLCFKVVRQFLKETMPQLGNQHWISQWVPLQSMVVLRAGLSAVYTHFLM